MLLILMVINCLAGQPQSANTCSMSAMKAFDVSNEGVRAACNAFLAKPLPNQQKALTVIYAQGITVRMANASGACSSIPENKSPSEFRKAFFENVWSNNE